VLAPLPVNWIAPALNTPVPEIVIGSGTLIVLACEIDQVAPSDTVVVLNVSPFLPRALA